MIKLSLAELLKTGACEWFAEHWQVIHHDAIGQPVYMADCTGVRATLRCPPGAKGLWLLRHAWSGRVEISCGGASQVVDLHAAEEDHHFVVPLEIPPGQNGEIQLRLAGADDQRPVGAHQVWLLGLAFDAPPAPQSRSYTVSTATRLISGEWGRFLVLTTDTDIPNVILNEGVWARQDIELFRKHIRPGDCVVDIGTHVGHHTVVFSKLVGAAGMVLAIEAQRVMFQLLNANCVINGASNVRPLHMAAAEREQQLTLFPVSYSGEGNFGSLGINATGEDFGEGHEGETVQAGPVDDAVERHCAGRRVAFIKIDVQAYEKYALAGLLRTLSTHRPAVFFEISPVWMHKAGYDYRDIYRMLRRIGYRFEHFKDLPMGADGIPDCAFDHDIEWDTLALPADGGAQP